MRTCLFLQIRPQSLFYFSATSGVSFQMSYFFLFFLAPWPTGRHFAESEPSRLMFTVVKNLM